MKDVAAARRSQSADRDLAPRAAPGRTTLSQPEAGTAGRGPKGSVFSLFKTGREQLVGNPGELAGTEHRAPTMADVPHYAAPAPADAHIDGARLPVHVVRSEVNPLELAPATRPAALDLWEVHDPSRGPTPPEFVEIEGYHGTIMNPIIDELAAPTLFVGDGPRPDDVDQGALGDCYFLSVLMSMAQRDPGRIQSMVRPDGRGGATVTMWRRLGQDYLPVDVHVSGELLADKQGGLRGARPRAAHAPISTDWWARIDTTRLEVHRRDLFEVARWAPLMEKAYARLAQQYGKDAIAAAPAGTQSGYDVIGNGGWPSSPLLALYGEEKSSQAAFVSSAATQWYPGASSGQALLAANQPVIDQLVRIAARGHEPTQAETDAPVMVAVAMSADMMKRLGPAVNAALEEVDDAALRCVLDAWLVWARLPADSAGVTAKADAQRAVELAAAAAVAAGSELHASTSPAVQAAVDLMLDVQAGNDAAGSGQRNILGNHAYSVVGAWFVDGAWQQVPLHTTAKAERTQLYARVDTKLSSVRLRNPHHTNEPDRLGNSQPTRSDDGSPDGIASDGMFTLSLEEFLRNFSRAGGGVFRRSP